MIKATLADLRQSSSFFETNQIVHIINGRKKEDIGYFVPNVFKQEFEGFLKKLEKKKKRELLHRVAKASAMDAIGDGAVDDAIR